MACYRENFTFLALLFRDKMSKLGHRIKCGNTPASVTVFGMVILDKMNTVENTEYVCLYMYIYVYICMFISAPFPRTEMTPESDKEAIYNRL